MVEADGPSSGLIAGPVAVLGAMSAAPALAIPEAEAIKKLQVIPVFVITDANGIPLPIPRDEALVLPSISRVIGRTPSSRRC